MSVERMMVVYSGRASPTAAPCLPDISHQLGRRPSHGSLVQFMCVLQGIKRNSELEVEFLCFPASVIRKPRFRGT